MKPLTRIACIATGRRKMQFETQKSADRFIEFNAEAIRLESGFAPVRSYLCDKCHCWHITSEQYKGEHLDNKAEQHLRMMNKRILTKISNCEKHINDKQIQKERRVERSFKRENLIRDYRKEKQDAERQIKEAMLTPYLKVA